MRSEIVALRDIYRGWMGLLMATLRTPSGDVERHIMLNREAVCVLPYDPERRTAIVVSMLRAPVAYAGEPDMLEAIAGSLDGADPADCARREALEEGGVRLGMLEPVARAWTMPSNSTERLAFYLAPYRPADRIGDGGGIADEHENITVHELPLEALWRLVDTCELRDGKLLLLLQALRIRRPDLFA
ncbi:NUDIX domain-containing protein [Sphingoaurantiacus capsulatus]|uniref:GDP-mannose pyrophosphatase n=1 Tax=Sphingoaurantiacus capsulatus TaxID=1771310 RepID=A0ABV7X929_9SPHN